MKKKVALLSMALLAGAFVFSAAACEEKDASLDTGKLGYDITYTISHKTVDGLPKDYSMGDEEGTGLRALYKINYDEYAVPQDVNFQVYDMQTLAAVTDAVFTFEYEEWIEITYGFMADGVFYLGTPDEEGDFMYTLYTRTGKTELGKGYMYEDDNTFYAEEGVRYYVNPKGEIVKEENEFARFLTYDETPYKSAYELQDYFENDYYFEGFAVNDYYLMNNDEETLLSVFDTNGKYLSNVDLFAELQLPEFFELSQTWIMSNRVYLQYVVELPYDADKYDVVVEGGKYNMYTVWYDVKEDKVGEWKDFDFAIQDLYGCTNDYVLLKGNAIKDTQLLANSYLQAYDKDGKVYVDVQKLVSNAQYMSMGNGAVWNIIQISDGDVYYYYNGKKLIYTEMAGEDVMFLQKTMIVEGDEALYFYNLNGKFLSKVTGIEDWEVMSSMDIWYATETEIVVYDTDTQTTKTLTTLNNEDGKRTYYVTDNHFIRVYDKGEDLISAEDDKVSYYFLMEGMTDIVDVKPTVYVELDSDYMYEKFTANGIEMAMMYTLTYVDENGDETVTYHVYTIKIESEDLLSMMGD